MSVLLLVSPGAGFPLTPVPDLDAVGTVGVETDEQAGLNGDAGEML
jgi:hypothetical protein